MGDAVGHVAVSVWRRDVLIRIVRSVALEVTVFTAATVDMVPSDAVPFDLAECERTPTVAWTQHRDLWQVVCDAHDAVLRVFRALLCAYVAVRMRTLRFRRTAVGWDRGQNDDRWDCVTVEAMLLHTRTSYMRCACI